GAFKNCKSLASATIAEGVKEIGKNAFEGSGLKTLTIPKGIKGISESAFYNCKSLETVTLSRSVTDIGSSAFYDCVSLKSISIPRNVTHIYRYAFENCDNLIVQFDGTKEQWQAIKKAEDGIFGVGDIGTFAVHCSDGDFSKQKWRGN
ncbi:MAG: leucine-rich repeat domain-containing protein, partial [Clostridiales bacterium]|nr:leucine-rich repeat domain-containing protein [Clostridiales bacterium]